MDGGWLKCPLTPREGEEPNNISLVLFFFLSFFPSSWAESGGRGRAGARQRQEMEAAAVADLEQKDLEIGDVFLWPETRWLTAGWRVGPGEAANDGGRGTVAATCLFVSSRCVCKGEGRQEKGFLGHLHSSPIDQLFPMFWISTYFLGVYLNFLIFPFGAHIPGGVLEASTSNSIQSIHRAGYPTESHCIYRTTFTPTFTILLGSTMLRRSSSGSGIQVRGIWNTLIR